ncbi:hypothetical protein DES40_2055 [Litorimonas taeanensis]|uniref:Uncharacterized protein n=1 Tax=Litorimonas taeanensis TaxID=568099 RepID=A0A420WE39_9PROT|nr:hypothetical protein [Litorimonas taeanensis]RKQ69256.1 hypothetical protein DES40_2055 [Litorimonas taeanensis]
MSGKSKEEIAFELVSKLKGVGVWGENNRAEILDMYAECLEATSGLRKVKGVTSAAAISAPAPQQFAPQQALQTAPLQANSPQGANPQRQQQAAPQIPQPSVNQQGAMAAPMAQGYNPAAQQR